MSTITERFEAGRRLWDDPEAREALRRTMVAELKRRGIDDVDDFLRAQEASPPPKDPNP